MKNKNIFQGIQQWLKKILNEFRKVGIWNWIGIASLIVGVIGIYITLTISETTTATIQVVDWKGKNNNAINESGSKIRIWLGNEPQEYKSITDGKVEFSEIPAKYKNKDVKIEFQPAVGYGLYIKDTTILLQTKESSKLKIYWYGLDSIRGNIIDNDTGTSIDSAKITINGQSVYSDSFGNFEMSFQPDKQEIYQGIEINKTNYDRYYHKEDMRTNIYNPITFKLQRSNNK